MDHSTNCEWEWEAAVNADFLGLAHSKEEKGGKIAEGDFTGIINRTLMKIGAVLGTGWGRGKMRTWRASRAKIAVGAVQVGECSW